EHLVVGEVPLERFEFADVALDDVEARQTAVAGAAVDAGPDAPPDALAQDDPRRDLAQIRRAFAHGLSCPISALLVTFTGSFRQLVLAPRLKIVRRGSSGLMSAWRRFKRMVRSWFGWAAELGEDPELILKQNIRDLEAEVPKINEQLAALAGQKNIADRELQKMKEQEGELVSKAKAALKAGRRDIAQSYVLELEKLKPQITEKERAVKTAAEGLAKAQDMKKVFMMEKDKKIQEAQRALSAKRQADWNEKV